ncbi:unnamed protein product, partial [Aphanomyces euteiches]
HSGHGNASNGTNQTVKTSSQVRLQGEPPLPTPSRYDGTMVMEKKKNMQLYQEYWFQCATLRKLGYQPNVMPIGACIAHARRMRNVKFDMRKPAELVTEDEWIAYLF